MTTYVLCHGAWSGGWGYRRVAKIIRAAGHEVFIPTYTGVGERSHLATPEVNLETHIQDVQGVIKWERLEEFVLVGHSYGGMVITGVADREYKKISRIVYLDAFLPQDGQCLNDLTKPAQSEHMFNLANEQGDGWRVPRPDGSIANTVSADDRAWIVSLSSAQPLATFTQKLNLTGNHLKIAEKVYVLATERKETPFYQFANWSRKQSDWQTIEIPIHHHLLQLSNVSAYGTN
jgi:pimeloyl-ACP methyl ester carboxylesterase